MRILQPGHGWLRPLPNGLKARCGGPGLCKECSREEAWLKEAVGHLYNWKRYGGDNFHSLMFTMFQKGSHGNRERLGEGFPWEFEAWNQWQAAPNENEFFERFGIREKQPTSKEAPVQPEK